MGSRTRGEALGAPHPPSAVRPGGWPAILVRKRNPYRTAWDLRATLLTCLCPSHPSTVN